MEEKVDFDKELEKIARKTNINMRKSEYAFENQLKKLDKDIDKVIYNTKCKKVKLTPKNGTIRLCCDGEIQDAGRVEFEIVPKAFNFVVPKK